MWFPLTAPPALKGLTHPVVAINVAVPGGGPTGSPRSKCARRSPPCLGINVVRNAIQVLIWIKRCFTI